MTIRMTALAGACLALLAVGGCLKKNADPQAEAEAAAAAAEVAAAPNPNLPRLAPGFWQHDATSEIISGNTVPAAPGPYFSCSHPDAVPPTFMPVIQTTCTAEQWEHRADGSWYMAQTCTGTDGALTMTTKTELTGDLQQSFAAAVETEVVAPTRKEYEVHWILKATGKRIGDCPPNMFPGQTQNADGTVGKQMDPDDY